jgi:hypothetical protein
MTGGDRKEASVVMRPFEESDIPQALEIMTEALGGGRVTRTEAFFRWKHFRNPFGRSIGLVVQNQGGGLVALRMFQRWGLRRNDAQFECMRAVDTATAPAEQGKGHFRRLTLAALAHAENAGADLVFNTPNEQSGAGYMKMGWRFVGKPGVWLRASRPSRASLADSAPDPSLLVSRHPDEAPDRDGRIHTRHDEAYWRWRYLEIPDLEYRMLCHGTATAIFRRQVRRGVTELTVAELLHPSSIRGTRDANKLLLALVRHGGTFGISAMGRSTSSALALASAGFVWTPLGPRLAARGISKDGANVAQARISDWRLSIGDLELF